MTPVRIPREALVLVGDGEKAIFLRNRGDEEYPNLVVERLLEHDNPPTREQGADQPGRLNDALGHKSAVENTGVMARVHRAWPSIERLGARLVPLALV